MGKYSRKLIIVFILIILMKLILSFFVFAPTKFADEYYIQRMAQSFSRQEGFLINEIPSKLYPPLYPMVLSISFLFTNMEFVYASMKIINAIISSTILFASFLLAKEFMSKKKSLNISLLISFIPPIFGFFPFIMTENLFYPLFLFTLFFMYKSLIDRKLVWPILTGLFIGLCSLTKLIGLFLIPAYGIILIIKLAKDREIFEFFKKSISSGILFLLIYLWWMLRNFYLVGTFFGTYTRNISWAQDKLFTFQNLPLLPVWILTYLWYFTFCCAVIYFIYFLLYLFKKKCRLLNNYFLLSGIVILIYLLNVVFYSYPDYQIMGRYGAHLIPLVFLGGYAGLNKGIKINKKLILFLILSGLGIMVYSFQGFKFFPVNNFSLSYFGAANYLFGNFSLILIFLVPLLFLFVSNLNKKNIFIITLIFFLLVNLIAFGINAYNSDYVWDVCEYNDVGRWFNKLNVGKDKLVVFDERDDRRVITKDSSDICNSVAIRDLTSFWINSKVIGRHNVSDLKGVDYVITPFKMDLELIKKWEKVYIYKV